MLKREPLLPKPAPPPPIPAELHAKLWEWADASVRYAETFLNSNGYDLKATDTTRLLLQRDHLRREVSELVFDWGINVNHLR